MTSSSYSRGGGYPFKQQFAPGDILTCPEDVIFTCQDGVVLLSTYFDSGDEGILGIVTPGMSFGRPLTSVSPYLASALTRVQLQATNVADLRTAPHQSPELLWTIVERLRSEEMFVAMVSRRRVGERFNALLLLLAQQVGKPVDGGVLIGIRLTHQQIANAINTTRVTVTRLMREYRELGLIADRQQHILICDPLKLVDCPPSP